MSKNPPYCFICDKNCKDIIDECVYCICDVTVCSNCLNSIKKNDRVWICPNCHTENDIQKSKLIRK
jgi:hypothetical protein